jgi:hypothetical protein
VSHLVGMVNFPMPPLLRGVRFRLAWLRFDFRTGMAEGCPICCTFRFTAEHAWSPRRRLALERVGWIDDRRYVPCGVLHRSVGGSGDTQAAWEELKDDPGLVERVHHPRDLGHGGLHDV